MTYRINPKTGDRVSLLGYGCMRLITVLNGTTRDSDAELDQEAINRSADYAIEHGVNYFATALFKFFQSKAHASLARASAIRFMAWRMFSSLVAYESLM